MKAILKTLPCEDGDCIFMRLIDERNKDSYHIMVDCGALSSDITDYICTDLNKRIDLLIATHIDSDHYNGIEMLFRRGYCNEGTSFFINLDYAVAADTLAQGVNVDFAKQVIEKNSEAWEKAQEG